MTLRKEKGFVAEKEALLFLQQQGLQLIEQNYTCFHGEIDLIMQDNADVVFVEVRFRTRIDYGNAVDTISASKIKKIIKAASHYLQRKKLLYSCHSRFDIVAIHPIEGKIQLEWIKNAFLANG